MKKVARASIVAAAAAAVGYYFYASKDAARNRQIVVKWSDGFRRDVLKKASRLPRIDRSTITAAVDSAASTYGAARGIAATDVARIAQEFKRNWRKLAAETKKRSPGARKSVARRKRS